MLRAALLFAAIPLAAGCAGSFTRAIVEYEHGEYPQAQETLAAVERDTTAWSPGERARYALYRGLTHLALGDRAATARWLGEARRAHDVEPSFFSDEEAGRLASAWAHLPKAR